MSNFKVKRAIKILAIVLAKSSFYIYAADDRGQKVLTKKMTRSQLSNFVSKLPACLIAMEACGSAHYWARKFQEYGHEVKLIAPQFVKPFVKSNKNDSLDAEAICILHLEAGYKNATLSSMSTVVSLAYVVRTI